MHTPAAGTSDVEMDAAGDDLIADAMRLVAASLKQSSGLAEGLTMRLADCGAAAASYSDEDQTVTLCRELAEVYRELADRAMTD